MPCRVLQRENKFTIDKMIAAGYDNYLSAFEILVPALLQRYAQLPATDSLYSQLAEPVAKLKTWDYRSDVYSVATTVAVHWAERMAPELRKIYVDQGENDQVQHTRLFAASSSAETLLKPLAETVADLNKKFGTWEVPWGGINRMQRISNSPELTYDDNLPSTSVGFASATWGMLPSYNSRSYPGTIKRYGYHGNSFVCAVEFGNKVHAKSLLAGGNSGDMLSPHFADQLDMYANGRFKDVLFYKEDVLKQTERSYHPGQ